MTPPPDPVDEMLAARTPAEAMRHWMIERLWISSIAAAVLLLILIGILWLGDWSRATEAMRLKALAGIALGAVVFQLVVAWSFSLGGPVGRWEARWGNRSLSAADDAAARQAYDGAAA